MRLRTCSLTALLLLASAGMLTAQPVCNSSLCNPSMDCMMPCYSLTLQKTITCLQYGTCNRDPDADGVLWENDNCPRTANSNQADCDGDRVGDVCDSLNGTFVPTGSKTVCASDKDDHVVYFTIEVTYQQRFVDTSSCHAPDRWNHYVYSADCVNISDHYCCINDLLSSSDQWICTPIGQYSCNPDTIP